MAVHNKILIFNNDLSAHKVLNDVLVDFSLTFVEKTEEVLPRIAKESYHLIIIAVNLSDKVVHQIVEELQSKQQNVMLIYLPTDKVIEHTVKNVDYCELESINQTYGKELFTKHVTQKIEQYVHEQASQSELNEVTNAMLSLQNDNAKLYDICRFLQHSFFCKDIPALCEQLFVVTRAFGTSCTMYIHSEKNNFFISDGAKTEQQMSQDILKLLQNEARIFQFGQGRAVFNWADASLLVNKLGDDVDNLAMLMDGFEIGFKAIESVDEFHQVLEQYRKQNQQLNLQVAEVIENVASNISVELNSLDAGSSLTLEQEEALIAIGDKSRSEIDVLFNKRLGVDEELSQIITKMRTAIEEPSETEDDDGDSIDFF